MEQAVKWVVLVLVWWGKWIKCNILISHFVMNIWHKKECATITLILDKYNIKNQRDLCLFHMECLRHITIWWEDTVVNTLIKTNFNKVEMEVITLVMQCLLKILILMIWAKIVQLIRLNPKDPKNQICLFSTYLMTGVKIIK